MAEDAVPVERDAAVRAEIGGDTRAGGDPVVQGDDARVVWFERGHRARKRVAQTRYDLKQRQIGIAEPRADEVAAAGVVARQHPLKIAKIFRHP